MPRHRLSRLFSRIFGRCTTSISLSSFDSDIKPKKHTFSTLFQNEDGKADLILVSKDGISFALQRSLLVAHSSVFEKLLLPVPRPRRSRTDLLLLPVLDIPEKSKAFELFLRYVVPKAYLLDGSSPRFPPFSTPEDTHLLRSVLEIASKYKCSSILDVVSKQHLPLLIRSSPLDGWAIASKFGRLDEAREAIWLLSSQKVALAGARRWEASSRSWVEGERDVGLGEVSSLEILGLVPVGAVRGFSRVHSKVVACQDGSYTWLEAGEEFEFLSTVTIQ
ncbi:hypothetical protein BDY24DRAFT_131195 [Mrakia frigida]|uniref:uncharacterized protein n=1 Tax=Mrakia frigida TaxID=29902 RepID=UPI003FCBFDA3